MFYKYRIKAFALVIIFSVLVAVMNQSSYMALKYSFMTYSFIVMLLLPLHAWVLYTSFLLYCLPWFSMERDIKIRLRQKLDWIFTIRLAVFSLAYIALNLALDWFIAQSFSWIGIVLPLITGIIFYLRWKGLLNDQLTMIGSFIMSMLLLIVF